MLLKTKIVALDTAIDEMRQRRTYTTQWRADCRFCGDSIEEGDALYFFGNKEKMCSDCRDNRIAALENLRDEVQKEYEDDVAKRDAR